MFFSCESEGESKERKCGGRGGVTMMRFENLGLQYMDQLIGRFIGRLDKIRPLDYRTDKLMNAFSLLPACLQYSWNYQAAIIAYPIGQVLVLGVGRAPST